MPERRILLGVIGRAHGVRGLVHVHSHTADPADLTAYGPLSDPGGRRFVLRWRGEGIAELAELRDGREVKVADRTAAERLTNTRLLIDRAALPVLAEDEFYLADLVGLAARGVDGAVIGSVAAVHDYGAGTFLQIDRPGGGTLLVPFTQQAVPAVDLTAGALTVVPPAEIEPAVPTDRAPPMPAPSPPGIADLRFPQQSRGRMAHAGAGAGADSSAGVAAGAPGDARGAGGRA